MWIFGLFGFIGFRLAVWYLGTWVPTQDRGGDVDGRSSRSGTDSSAGSRRFRGVLRPNVATAR